MAWLNRGTHGGRMITAGLLIVLGIGGVGLAQAQDDRRGDRRAPRRPASEAEQRGGRQHPNALIDRILTRLERRQINDLRARVYWRLHYVNEEPESDVRRIGEIFYLHDRPVSKFKILFRERRVGTTKQRLAEEHLFDGIWYVKLDQQTKTVERRQVRRADDPINPFKLGEGPFPIPFGQSKESILREFDVVLLAPARGDPRDTDHLMLTPRAGTASARDYKYVHFWIEREGDAAGLPVRVKAGKLKPTGELDADILVEFSDPSINDGLARNMFQIAVPRGYTETVETLEQGEVPAAPDALDRERPDRR